MTNDRINQLASDIYDYVFQTVDAEHDADGDDAGRIATAVQKAFEDSALGPMNTIENTPAHCHDCPQFADCRQAQNMMADTPPEEGCVHDGEVYCIDCAKGFGYGARFEGEADSPTHCSGCGVPIIHDLTTDGVEYVRASLAEGGGCCRELWPTVWADYDV